MRVAQIAGFAVVLSAAMAVAQIHGVPASVTSSRGGGQWGFVPGPGPRASVTSLGPRGFGGGGRVVVGGCGATPGLVPSALGCNNPIFYPNVNFETGQVQFNGVHTRGPRRVPRGFNGGAYYPYPVYVPVMNYSDYTTPVAEEPPAVVQPPQPVQPVQIQIVVDDKRASAQPQEAIAAPVAPTPSKPEAEAPATVLVFKDGHQEEVRNYAIVGQTLYDLGTFVAHKIPLASLDLDKTVKVNEDRGIEFTLPSRKS